MAKAKKAGPLNVDRLKKLYKELGTVAAVVKRTGRSYTGIRRQLVIAKLIK